MTRIVVKAALLDAVQAAPHIDPAQFAETTGTPLKQVLRALRKLRTEGRVTGKGCGPYAYVPESVPVHSSIHDLHKAARARRAREQRAAVAAMPTLPLVQWAQINSPTSVWAYAARSAS